MTEFTIQNELDLLVLVRWKWIIFVSLTLLTTDGAERLDAVASKMGARFMPEKSRRVCRLEVVLSPEWGSLRAGDLEKPSFDFGSSARTLATPLVLVTLWIE